tara:strand:+ start:895 stop:1098 length:204 start_codon:yes stop_codon:yes gene_type:complete
MATSIKELVETALKDIIGENKLVIKDDNGETMDDLSIEFEDETSWEDEDNEDEDEEDQDEDEDKEDE